MKSLSAASRSPLTAIDVAAPGQGTGKLRVLRDHLVAVGKRLVEATHLGIGDAAIGRDLPALRIERLAFGEIGERRFILLAQGLHAPEIEQVGIAVVAAVERKGDVEFVVGALQLAAAQENQAAIVVGRRENSAASARRDRSRPAHAPRHPCCCRRARASSAPWRCPDRVPAPCSGPPARLHSCASSTGHRRCTSWRRISACR